MLRVCLKPLGAMCTLLLVLFGQPAAVRTNDTRIVSQVPEGLTPAAHLTAEDRRDNFEALWKAIDTTYAHFTLKSIDWNEVGRRYRARLDSVTSDAEFYHLLSRMVADLRDTHSWLQNYREPPLSDVPSVAVDRVEGKAFVVAVAPGSEAEAAGIIPGWELVSVDGLAAADKMEALRAFLPGFSSQRAFTREATRRLLAADKATPATMTFRLPAGVATTVTLPRGSGKPLRRPAFSPGFALTRLATVHVGVHPSGIGYIRILSFGSREQLDEEFDRALDEVRHTPALILDIRDNTGGFSHPRIVGRFLSKRTQTTVDFVKNGPAHDALTQRASYVVPAGSWQYTAPVALLVNDVTGSASDLFATELRSTGRLTIVGSTTHGNLSGTALYIVLPCQLVVRISNGYVADAQRRPIEVSGNAPDVAVEPTLADLLSGRDPVLDKAVSVLIAPRR